MKQFAFFEKWKIPEGMYTVIIVDGRNFHRVSQELKLETPYDPRFRQSLISAAKALMIPNDFQISLAYIQSDELSFCIPPVVKTFKRRVEKWISVFASIVTGSFCQFYQEGIKQVDNPIAFDARIYIFARKKQVYDFFKYRQRDCLTNCLNSYAYWMLRKAGASGSQAQRRLDTMKHTDKQEMLFSEFDLNFNEIPAEQKRGTIVVFKELITYGVNRLTGKSVVAKRNQIFDCVCPNLLTEELNLLVWNAIPTNIEGD